MVSKGIFQNCINPAGSGLGPLLPICTDADDQKFLELARDAEAEVLITKDKALLKLAKRTARAGLFRIMTPQEWRPDALPAGANQ